MPTLSAREAAKYCGVSEITMRRWITSGIIPAARDPADGRAYSIEQADLDRSGRVRMMSHPAAKIGATADHPSHDGAQNGATLAKAEDATGELTPLRGVREYLRDREATADARAAKAEAEAVRWAFEAGQWKTRAEALQAEARAATAALTAARARPWWARLLGL